MSLTKADSSAARPHRGAPLFFLAPALIGFAVFHAWPTGRALVISLTDWNLLDAPRWVGLDNYRELWGDGHFWRALGLTAVYALLNIGVRLISVQKVTVRIASNGAGVPA